jgi:WhiB family redox-sensing transcriptional regulator
MSRQPPVQKRIFSDPTFDMSLAECRNMDVSLFFPSEQGINQNVAGRKAIAACKKCKVLDACAEYAIHHETMGIWGGMTEREREYIRLERGIIFKEYNEQLGYAMPISTNTSRARHAFQKREQNRRKREQRLAEEQAKNSEIK